MSTISWTVAVWVTLLLIAPNSLQASDGPGKLDCLHGALQAQLNHRSAKPFSAEDQIRFESIRPDPKQLKSVANLVEAIHSKFSRHFPMPKNLEIVIKDEAPPFRGSPPEVMVHNMLSQNRTLYAADQERVVLVRDSNQKMEEAAIAHELGHGFFVEKMNELDPEWREGMGQMKNYLDGFRSAFRNGVGPNIEEQFRRIPPVTPELLQAKARIEVSLPYQELFADCVAAIGLNDPNAISSILLKEARATSLEQMEARARSFDTRQSKREIQELLRLGSSESAPESHVAFKPTRFYLWKQVFSKTEDPEQRVALLEQVFRAIAADMKEAYNHGNPLKRSAQEMNESLIRKIRALTSD